MLTGVIGVIIVWTGTALFLGALYGAGRERDRQLARILNRRLNEIKWEE